MDELDTPADGSNLVCVVGCPRSGTTWVQRLLGTHPKVHIGQESFVFSTYVAPQLQLWRAGHRGEYHPGTRSGRTGIGPQAYMLEREFLRSVRRYADELLEPMLGQLKPGEIFVDKTPTHALCIPEIKQLFPAARFVHVLRDPRDVAASWKRAAGTWGQGWVWRNRGGPAGQWLEHVSAVRQAERWMHAWDLHEVVYERLWSEPEAVLGELCAFLDLEWDDEGIEAAVAQNRAEVLRAGGGVRVPVGGEAARLGRTNVMREPEGFVGPALVGGWRSSLGLFERAQLWWRLRTVMPHEGYRWHWRDAIPVARRRVPAQGADW